MSNHLSLLVGEIQLEGAGFSAAHKNQCIKAIKKSVLLQIKRLALDTALLSHPVFILPCLFVKDS